VLLVAPETVVDPNFHAYVGDPDAAAVKVAVWPTVTV
jgi:hypothetical protein